MEKCNAIILNNHNLCEGNPELLFLSSFLPLPHPSFPSSSFLYHPPAYSVHHSSPCIWHCFIPAVYLPSLPPPLQHIIPHTNHPSDRHYPSHSYTLSSLFISPLHLSLSPDSLRWHTQPTLASPLLLHIPPFINSPLLNCPYTCPPPHLTLAPHQFIRLPYADAVIQFVG